MADHQDRTNEQEDSRPFLASTEAHQATLMKNVKAGDKVPDLSADEPAPMLPAAEKGQHEIDFLPAEPETLDALSEAPTPKDEPLLSKDSLSDQAESHDAAHTPTVNFYPNSRRIVAGVVAAFVALVGFSAIWFNANQDIYTLGGSDDGQSSKNEVANSNQSTPADSKPATLGAETGSKQLASLQFHHLHNLEQGYYFLWLKQGDNYTSLGSFTLNDKGNAVDEDGKVLKPKVSYKSGDELLVSIESSDNPETPSNSIILQGKINDDKAELAFTAIDLSNASGVYTIAAPTDLSGGMQSSGIWFAKTDGHELTGPGLNVPHAPEGWRYEAQLVYKDEVIAAGRFSRPDDRDDFGVFTPNPDHTPHFPGEDYLQGAPSRLGVDFPADLTTGDWKVIISLEPDTNGSDPSGDGTFFIQPFTATIAKGTENYKEQSLNLDVSKLPTAIVVFK